jgi:hypothetical protein
MFSGIAKVVLFSVGLSPTLISVLIAGVMLGKPQPCQTQPCVRKVYGAEALLLPMGPLLSLACGYLIGRMSSDRSAKSKDTETETVTETEPLRVLTSYPEGGTDGTA